MAIPSGITSRRNIILLYDWNNTNTVVWSEELHKLRIMARREDTVETKKRGC